MIIKKKYVIFKVINYENYFLIEGKIFIFKLKLFSTFLRKKLF